MNKFLQILGSVFLAIALALLRIFVLGVVLMFLWNWFITPLGVISINYWLALGISTTINAFLYSVKRTTDEAGSASEAIGQSLGGTIGLLILWGFGALVSLFL